MYRQCESTLFNAPCQMEMLQHISLDPTMSLQRTFHKSMTDRQAHAPASQQLHIHTCSIEGVHASTPPLPPEFSPFRSRLSLSLSLSLSFFFHSHLFLPTVSFFFSFSRRFSDNRARAKLAVKRERETERERKERKEGRKRSQQRWVEHNFSHRFLLKPWENGMGNSLDGPSVMVVWRARNNTVPGSRMSHLKLNYSVGGPKPSEIPFLRIDPVLFWKVSLGHLLMRRFRRRYKWMKEEKKGRPAGRPASSILRRYNGRSRWRWWAMPVTRGSSRELRKHAFHTEPRLISRRSLDPISKPSSLFDPKEKRTFRNQTVGMIGARIWGKRSAILREG